MKQALVTFYFLIFGIIIGSYIPQPPAKPRFDLVFQKNDCSPTSCRFETTPKTLLLKFVPQDEFDRAVRNSDGYANIYKQPCEIVVPVGKIIVNKPDVGEAAWDFERSSYRMNEVLAHEILHCYIGRWHPEPGELGMNLLRKRRDVELETLAFSYKYRVPHLPAQNYELNKWQW